MHIRTIVYLLAGAAVLFSCTSPQSSIPLVVSNPSDLHRKEVVALETSHFSAFLTEKGSENIGVRTKGDSTLLVSQWVDLDQDSVYDELLFVAELKPHSAKAYELVYLEQGTTLQSTPGYSTFSRFVPERTDDYTWENDKVAFRTYGPEAQRMVEEGIPGGTLSSGIDLWLKRVPYPIINKWYAGNDTSPGFYHKDVGEGYDPYHVGTSRGTGGIGIWMEDTLLTSKNFTSYKTLATGPLRTVFELTYAPWGPYKVQETKRISLDLGSNFSRFDISLPTEDTPPNYAIGITLHNNTGDVEILTKEGIFRHWEAIDTSYVGEGIVLDPAYVKEAFVHQSEVPDQSQLLILTSTRNNHLVYYAGFGWTRSKQVHHVGEWDQMLKEQALKIAQPLTVEFK